MSLNILGTDYTIPVPLNPVVVFIIDLSKAGISTAF